MCHLNGDVWAVGLDSPKLKANASTRTTAKVFIFLLSLDWSSCLSRRRIWIWIMGWKCLPQWLDRIYRGVWYFGNFQCCNSRDIPHFVLTQLLFFPCSRSEVTNRKWLRCCSIWIDWELFVFFGERISKTVWDTRLSWFIDAFISRSVENESLQCKACCTLSWKTSISSKCQGQICLGPCCIQTTEWWILAVWFLCSEDVYKPVMSTFNYLSKSKSNLFI